MSDKRTAVTNGAGRKGAKKGRMIGMSPGSEESSPKSSGSGIAVESGLIGKPVHLYWVLVNRQGWGWDMFEGPRKTGRWQYTNGESLPSQAIFPRTFVQRKDFPRPPNPCDSIAIGGTTTSVPAYELTPPPPAQSFGPSAYFLCFGRPLEGKPSCEIERFFFQLFPGLQAFSLTDILADWREPSSSRWASRAQPCKSSVNPQQLCF